MNFLELRRRACLSHWFPKLEAAGLSVPKTVIVRTDLDLLGMEDGSVPADELKLFLDRLTVACQQLGPPVFLRTGQGSGKHQWKDTCHLTDVSKLSDHVWNLVEWSHLVDVFGLPTDVWAVRELLPAAVQFHAFEGRMPICREFRFFVRGGEVRYWRPYWPLGALKGHTEVEDLELRHDALCRLSVNAKAEVSELASKAGAAVGGNWSVDVIETQRGWYVTDMAPAEISYGYDAQQFKEQS